jgi:hypothetical protein
LACRSGRRRPGLIQANGLADECRVPASRGEKDQKWHANFRIVKAFTMVEQIVLAHSFAVVGGVNDQGLIKQAAGPQSIEQLSQFVVEVRDTAVIGVPSRVERGGAGR